MTNMAKVLCNFFLYKSHLLVVKYTVVLKVLVKFNNALYFLMFFLKCKQTREKKRDDKETFELQTIDYPIVVITLFLFP
jgi:hypothetical protein